MDKFPCSGCGLCCKGAAKPVAVAKQLIAEGNDNAYVREVAEFPYGFTESGACEKLTADNKCSVYEDRPLICNLKRVYEKFHSGQKVMSMDAYFHSTAMLCNSMMIEADVDVKYLIDLSKMNMI